MAEAEGWVPSARAPSWGAPSLGSVKTVSSAPWRRMLLQYSIPSTLLGCPSNAASAVSSAAAACRAAAKLTPSESLARRQRENSPLSSTCATCISASASPHSLPKAKWVTTPVASRVCTPPSANRSAEDTAQGSPSSITRSAPERTAASARAYLPTRAKSPLCTKSPLITQITPHSGPKRRRTCSIRCTWPLWRGLYSVMIPAICTEFTPQAVTKK